MSNLPLTLTPELEEKMVEAILANPEQHITMRPSAYRKDGALMVYRNGMSGIRAQRHLYERLIGPLGRAHYLYGPKCKVTGCINPYHYTLVNRSRGLPEKCPNGHRYTKANTLPAGRARCRKCHEAALAARRKPGPHLPTAADINRAKTHCRYNHEFTPENTYITHWHGSTRRRCRTCAIEYAQRWRHERKAS